MLENGSRRTLGIETSGISGSIALVEGGVVLATREHTEENRHAERMLGHLNEALAELRWEKHSLTHIAVSRGPGAFTGIRMGLALAQGLEMGLAIRAQGVSSLRALAASPFVTSEGRLSHPEAGSIVISVRDARRGEFFVGIFDSQFAELEPARIVPQEGARQTLLEIQAGRSCHFVGASCGFLGFVPEDSRANEPAFVRADPHAGAVALLSEEDSFAAATLTPDYLRGPNLIKPKLPPSPF